MENMKFRTDNRKAMAIGQILMLLVSTIAISYALGSEMGVVGAAVTSCSAPNTVFTDSNTFCYGSKIYQFTTSSVITDGDSFYFYDVSTDSWSYSSGPVHSPSDPTLSLSGTNLKIFDTLAFHIGLNIFPTSIDDNLITIASTQSSGETATPTTTSGTGTTTSATTPLQTGPYTNIQDWIDCMSMGGSIATCGEVPTSAAPKSPPSTAALPTASSAVEKQIAASSGVTTSKCTEQSLIGWCQQIIKDCGSDGQALVGSLSECISNYQAQYNANPNNCGNLLTELTNNYARLNIENKCPSGGSSPAYLTTTGGSTGSSTVKCADEGGSLKYTQCSSGEQIIPSSDSTDSMVCCKVQTSANSCVPSGGYCVVGQNQCCIYTSQAPLSCVPLDSGAKAGSCQYSSSSASTTGGSSTQSPLSENSINSLISAMGLGGVASYTSLYSECSKYLKDKNQIQSCIISALSLLKSKQSPDVTSAVEAAAKAGTSSTTDTSNLISICKLSYPAASCCDGNPVDCISGEGKIATTSPGGGLPAQSLVGNLLGLKGAAGIFFGHLIQGVVIGAAIYGGLDLLGQAIGISGNAYWDAVPLSLGVGWAAGETAYGIFGLGSVGAGFATFGIGLGAAGLTYLLAFQSHSQKTLVFTCVPWQANYKGGEGNSACEKCGSQGLPCTEYQCQSLGQGCELLNKGTENQVCVYANPSDTAPPTITFLASAMDNDKYNYANAKAITPPDTGVRIATKSGGAIPAYTPLQLGIQTNEPSRCRMDVLNKNSYDNMTFLMNSGLFETNHTFSLSIPNLNASNVTTPEIITRGGEMNIFIRCKDSNNNTDVSSYVIQFNVDRGQDTIPPVVVQTDPLNDSAIFHGIDSANVSVYVNEPVSGCKWDHSDKTYSKMENTMNCNGAKTLKDMNAQGTFRCIANLTGIVDQQLNTFYFRCNDTAGNVNDATPAYIYSLLGTQPLAITAGTPNNTIVKGPTGNVKVSIKVTTAGGVNKGQATCYYNSSEDSGSNGKYIMFDKTNDYQSTVDRWLTGGSNYKYTIKCVDNAGNAAYTLLNFTVQTDTSSPNVTRVYKEGNNLMITTDENASCVFDTVDCNYDPSNGGGIAMADVSKTSHSTPWVAGRTYYIKCKDEFNHWPLPVNKCSIIVTPSGS